MDISIVIPLLNEEESLPELTQWIEKVMEELRKGAGTRYNPDLVKLIDDIPELYKELERIAIYGWPDIYYEIYKNYMR